MTANTSRALANAQLWTEFRPVLTRASIVWLGRKLLRRCRFSIIGYK